MPVRIDKGGILTNWKRKQKRRNKSALLTIELTILSRIKKLRVNGFDLTFKTKTVRNLGFSFYFTWVNGLKISQAL